MDDEETEDFEVNLWTKDEPWDKEDIEEFMCSFDNSEFDSAMREYTPPTRTFNFSLWKWDVLIRVRG